jgi:hypothetical protein
VLLAKTKAGNQIKVPTQKTPTIKFFDLFSDLAFFIFFIALIVEL